LFCCDKQFPESGIFVVPTAITNNDLEKNIDPFKQGHADFLSEIKFVLIPNMIVNHWYLAVVDLAAGQYFNVITGNHCTTAGLDEMIRIAETVVSCSSSSSSSSSSSCPMPVIAFKNIPCPYEVTQQHIDDVNNCGIIMLM
jgi:hypothetical protein